VQYAVIFHLDTPLLQWRVMTLCSEYAVNLLSVFHYLICYVVALARICPGSQVYKCSIFVEAHCIV